MKRFADTHFFLALVSPSDSRHFLARQYAQDRQLTLVTTEWVLTEVADGLAPNNLRHIFGQIMERIHTLQGTKIIHADHALFETAVNFYRRRPDQESSLTDCTSFVVMQQLGITEALTGDHHFEQAGFVALFK